MLKTSKDFMKWLGLQVGDRIKINDSIYTVELNDYDEPIYIDEYSKIKFPITDLVNRNYEILPRPKRVGDLKCGFKKELSGIGSCSSCPVRIICSHYTCRDELGAGDTLYEYLETYKKKIKEEYEYEDEDYNDFDQEIYDLLKARLDKEVKEC